MYFQNKVKPYYFISSSATKANKVKIGLNKSSQYFLYFNAVNYVYVQNNILMQLQINTNKNHIESKSKSIHLNITVLIFKVMFCTGCSGKIVFFHNSPQPFPRLHRCKRPLKALNAMRVYSHSYWLVILCTTNNS